MLIITVFFLEKKATSIFWPLALGHLFRQALAPFDCRERQDLHALVAGTGRARAPFQTLYILFSNEVEYPYFVGAVASQGETHAASCILLGVLARRDRTNASHSATLPNHCKPTRQSDAIELLADF